MIKRTISIDFSHKIGKIKPVNGLNNGPRFGIDLDVDLSEQYKEMAPPLVRVSSVEAPYASSRYLDIHCIFPDMELDERFEASYNFAPTDRYLAGVKECGAEIFLRLGESPEPYEVKRYTRAPKDAMKLARICERIIAHYNKGWANGFKYNVKYIELMCDVDTPGGWCGTREEYFELYATVACYLKEQHPKLKIGAYSCGGFTALNHYDASTEAKSYLDFLDEFLNYITRVKTAPLDFLSWKCCAEAPEEVSLHANYARSYLMQYGLRKTQSVVSEFSLQGIDKGEHLERKFPASLARALIIAEKSNLDMLFCSHLDPTSRLNVLYSLDALHNLHLYSGYHVMTAFGMLSSLGNVVDTTEDYRTEIYSLATLGEDRGAIVFATADYSGAVEIRLSGKSFKSYSIKGIIGGGDRGSGFFTEEKGLPLRDDTITLRVGKNEVYFLTFS